MKKLISILMIVTMLFACITIPAAADEGLNYDLDKALEIVKEKLDLNTEGYDFNSSYSENFYNGRKVWDLHWYKSYGNGESISVTLDAMTGEIINYNTWGPYQENYRKLPKYSKEQALEVAQEFLNKIAPEKLEEVTLFENPYDRYAFYNEYYYFNFNRKINDIPFDSNNISIGIDKNTLKVRTFYLNWDNGTFPSVEDVIGKDAAKKAFAEKQGIELSYQLIYPEPNKPQAILVYTTKGNSPIDAITGELIYNAYYYPPYYGGGYYEKMAYSSYAYDRPVVTEEEQKDIDKKSTYITKEKAVEIVRAQLPEVDSYTQTHASLNPSYGTENATWNLNWNKNDDKSGKYAYISASVDAVTSELKSFYKGDSDMYNTDGKEAKITEEQGKEIAADFLKKIQPEKFASAEYYKYENNFNPQYPQPVYNYNFIRKENGVFCNFNSLYVSVSAYTGEIVNYSYYWINVDLPKVDKIIDLDKAYEALYTKGDMVLRYIKQYDYSAGMEKSEIKLAYVLDNFYGMIDANTGTIIGYDGKELLDVYEPFSFTDIEGHAAEADIQLLLEVGVLDPVSSEFAPDENILQKDFVKMLVKSMEPPYRYYPMYDMSKPEAEYDYYYQTAIQKKLITERDKNPDGYVTKQDAAKMLVRALGYGYIADKANLFVMPFEDSNQIARSYRGSVVIADELGIFKAVERKFGPKKLLTRGESATALVNYLKVDTTINE